MGLYKKFLQKLHTAQVNFALFGIRGIKEKPILTYQKINTRLLRPGMVEIQCEWKKGMIELGMKGTPFVQERNTYLAIINGGKIVIHGPCIIAQGYRIFVNGGQLEIGSNVYINKNFTAQCEDKICIGNRDLLGWNVTIRDTDGHPLVKNGEITQYRKPISIADDVWITADCTILKGSAIASGSVVGCNSLLVGKKFEKPRCIIAGAPAKVISEDVQWFE